MSESFYSRNDFRAMLCSAQDARSFASSGWRQEHDCAVACPSTADRLHCRHIDTCPREFREDVSDSTGAVVAVNVKRRAFAQPKLGLLCGGDKSSTILWYKLELRPPFSVGISPDGDEIDSRIAECTQNACSFADLVSDGRCVVFDLPNLCHEASFRRTCLHCKPCAEDRCVQKDEVGQLSLNPEGGDIGFRRERQRNFALLVRFQILTLRPFWGLSCIQYNEGRGNNEKGFATDEKGCQLNDRKSRGG